MFLIGEIISTHGIKGEVKVKQITDFIERFHIGETVYYKSNQDKLLPLIIDGFRTTNKGLLIQFKGYSSINDVEHLLGMNLYIKEEQLTALEENEYYFHEIIGCNVKTTTGENLGIIDSILTPGANDVWVIKSRDGKEILIPYIEDVVKQVNIAEKEVTIELMEGLID